MQSLIMRLDTQRSLCQPLWMARPIGERIKKLRNEIAEISEANRAYLQGGKKGGSRSRWSAAAGAIASNPGWVDGPDWLEENPRPPAPIRHPKRTDLL